MFSAPPLPRPRRAGLRVAASFAADATFTRTAGLANASWTTLRSWNYPDRVLRHQGFRLRIDPINASSPLTDREDATFALTR